MRTGSSAGSGREGSHSEGATATRQQDGGNGGGDAFGVLLDRAGQSVKQSGAGGADRSEAVNQRSIPRVIAVPWHTPGAYAGGARSTDCQAAAIRQVDEKQVETAGPLESASAMWAEV